MTDQDTENIDHLEDLADKWEREADAADTYDVEKARLNCAFELREYVEQQRRCAHAEQ